MKQEKIILLCVFTALICASWLFVLPLGFVPIVMQNAVVLATSALLGYLGILATALFLLLGILGLPVFYGGRSGLLAFLNPTGGYLLGYLFGAIIVAILTEKLKPSKFSLIFSLILGFLFIYIPGILWLKFSLELTWKEVFFKGFLPFLLADFIKLIILVPLISRLRRIIKR